MGRQNVMLLLSVLFFGLLVDGRNEQRRLMYGRSFPELGWWTDKLAFGANGQMFFKDSPSPPDDFVDYKITKFPFKAIMKRRTLGGMTHDYSSRMRTTPTRIYLRY